ncbi:MAG: response regulator [Candidatus Omnitrophica bacterium]|nr:response regulator [Candidatus Omnitrophota bacterium]
MNQTRVLIVDDDPTMLRLMESYMQQLGCRAVFAANGREAVAKVGQFSFDICFMDIMMPVMGGVEASSIIREEYTKVLPIVAVTSVSMKASREKCEDVGMVDFITKPVELAVVKQAIERYALRSP